MGGHATIDSAEIYRRIRDAGVAGAGGAGFPSYAKWTNLDDINYLLMNHQESEPNYYSDKWLAREYAEEFTSLFKWLLEDIFDAIVVGSKEKYREQWISPLEEATGGTIHRPEDLPLDVEEESEVTFAYTDDIYDYSEEQVLLMIAVGTRIGRDLPTEHGWIVHNTETMYNISRALSGGTPVTRKIVHVDGNTPSHRCLDVPIGTTGETLLEAAGVDPADLGPNQVLADGGPGWCYKIEEPPAEFGTRKRTNAVLVLDRDVVDEHTEQEGRINVLEARDWHDREHEVEPSKLDPDLVRIPLITNAAYEGFVAPSEPCVEPGDSVSVGDVVAEPGEGEVAIPQHASIEGTVTGITDTHVIIE